MSRSSQLRLMATYNRWMNDKVYAAAASLPAAELAADRKAFFGSILGTLNHIVAGDTIWLKRFAAHPTLHPALDPVRALPAPQGLNHLQFTDFAELTARRELLDQAIIDWTGAMDDTYLDQILHYENSAGLVWDRNFHLLLTHFFNHQTHHRGQVTTLLSQAGVDVGGTDLVTLIPNEAV